MSDKWKKVYTHQERFDIMSARHCSENLPKIEENKTKDRLHCHAEVYLAKKMLAQCLPKFQCIRRRLDVISSLAKRTERLHLYGKVLAVLSAGATPKSTSPCCVLTLRAKTEVSVNAPGTFCRTCWKMPRQRSHSSGRGFTFHQTQKGLLRLRTPNLSSFSEGNDKELRTRRRQSQKNPTLLRFSYQGHGGGGEVERHSRSRCSV